MALIDDRVRQRSPCNQGESQLSATGVQGLCSLTRSMPRYTRVGLHHQSSARASSATYWLVQSVDRSCADYAYGYAVCMILVARDRIQCYPLRQEFRRRQVFHSRGKLLDKEAPESKARTVLILKHRRRGMCSQTSHPLGVE
jgi:hypothetical protein